MTTTITSARPTSAKTTRKANEIDLQIGKRLRKWRLAQDVEACELAHRLGITQQQLQKYEKGQTRIAASRLYEIAQTLNIPVHWFFLEPTSSDHDHRLLTERFTVSAPAPSDQDCSGHKLLRRYLKIEDKGVRRALFELMAILVGEPAEADARTGEVEPHGQQ